MRTQTWYSACAVIFVCLNALGIIDRQPKSIEAPFIVVAASSTATKGGGLLLAVWKDGKALMRSRLNQLESELVLVECDADSIKTVFEELKKTGYPTAKPFPQYPDGTYTSIRIQLDDTAKPTKLKWDEALTSVPESGPSRSDSLASVRVWCDVRSVIWRITPVKTRALSSNVDASGRFRGYLPANPYDVDWMH